MEQWLRLFIVTNLESFINIGGANMNVYLKLFPYINKAFVSEKKYTFSPNFTTVVLNDG